MKTLTERSAGLSHVCGHRFAAVRTLNKVAMTHPMAVTNCNIDMESLISDQNRSIATLAITTLLKTGNESSVDRLLKQVPSLHTHPFALLAMAYGCLVDAHALHCKLRHLSAVAPGLRLVQTSWFHHPACSMSIVPLLLTPAEVQGMLTKICLGVTSLGRCE